MSTSYTVSESFTVTHAKHLASKVISDMYQCQRFYRAPSAEQLEEYHGELIAMLAGGYIDEYEFGFKRNDQRIVSWQYRAGSNGDLSGGSDDRSGGVYARADITGAGYFNFMSYTSAWHALTPAQQDLVRAKHSIRRVHGTQPEDGSGVWATDRTYSNGGVAVTRRSFRPS